MTDIVERLRDSKATDCCSSRLEAADYIEQLRWENANMERLWGNSEGTWMEIRDKQDAEIERLREELKKAQTNTVTLPSSGTGGGGGGGDGSFYKKWLKEQPVFVTMVGGGGNGDFKSGGGGGFNHPKNPPPFITEEQEEIERLKTGNRLHLELAEIKEAEIKMLREHCDRMASLAIDNAKDTERALKQAEEIEKLREALQNIASKNPFHNQCPHAGDTNYFGKLIAEMVVIANAALKEKE